MSGYPCTKDLYKAFLQASRVRYSSLALSEVSPSRVSHDSVICRLKNRCFRPKELWQLVAPSIERGAPCLVIAADTVLAKKRSKKIELFNYQYSGNEQGVIAGIGLVNLLWQGLETGESVPIDYRIDDKETAGKTKSSHFCDMLKLAKARGISPEAVVMDAWYSSLDNLNAIRSPGWIGVTTLRKHRIVNRNVTLASLDIPEEGLSVHLRGDGWVTVFKFVAKHGCIDYVATNQETPTRRQISAVTEARRSVEVYHREITQTCGIERCQARTGRA
ncbi:IS701 family transposase [Candidatus Fukatsuia endosymbiont of Tuberolachnus salignus]|uniref:IS701 family transposase n=1 Tax=Candidatus Fukatsuia endosymbiont of Tuberolachnus salignus TaxID=3077957 RepID=UPI00313F0648